MKLTTEQYNIVKQILTIGVPGVSTLIVTLGGLYGFPTDVAVGTLTALATFAGVVLQIISNNYDKENKNDYGDGQEFTERKDD